MVSDEKVSSYIADLSGGCRRGRADGRSECEGQDGAASHLGGERSLDDPWGNRCRLVCEGRRRRIVSNGPEVV